MSMRAKPLSRAVLIGGKLIQHFSYRISFLSLGAVAALAFLLLCTAIPETLPERDVPRSGPSSPAIPQELSA
jgi:predicted MFS family arabinose efflux permease